jgi:hypothetical protein
LQKLFPGNRSETKRDAAPQRFLAGGRLATDFLSYRTPKKEKSKNIHKKAQSFTQQLGA